MALQRSKYEILRNGLLYNCVDETIFLDFLLQQRTMRIKAKKTQSQSCCDYMNDYFDNKMLLLLLCGVGRAYGTSTEVIVSFKENYCGVSKFRHFSTEFIGRQIQIGQERKLPKIGRNMTRKIVVGKI